MNEKIIEQVNAGFYENPYLAYSKKSKPALLSKRTQQVLNAVLLGHNTIAKPHVANEHLNEVTQTSSMRQMRYFGAWCFDQWDYALKHLQKSGYRKSTIKKVKEEFLSALHEDFTSGIAYNYADDWYQSFPNGGHFNPMRYDKLYDDEKNIAHLVSEYIQCNYAHPAIAMLMSYPKPEPFNHTFCNGGGSITLNYPTNSNVRDLLASEIDSIDLYTSEKIGEAECVRRDKRIFVTKSVEYTDGRSTCAVLFDQFDTLEKNYLASVMRAGIMEHIPLDYWRQYSINIAVEAGSVTNGEMDMARKYLTDEHSQMSFVPEQKNVSLNNNLLSKQSKDISHQYQ